MSETPRKSTQDAEDRALEALIVQRLRGDGELPELSEKEVAAMNCLGNDFITQLIADEPKTPEVLIRLTESQFRSLVKSIWDEGFSEGWHDGVGMQHESVSEHADSRFWLSNAETTVNKLIELEKSK